MTRFKFLTGLFGAIGIGEAQEPNKSTVRCIFASTQSARIRPDGIPWCEDLSAAVAVKPYQNNECPVCGTMAPPYKRKTERDAYGADTCLVPSDGRTALAICLQPSATKLVGPKHVQVEGGCKRCSAAFWQDAEN